MNTGLFFDTLAYTEKLKEQGIEHAETFAKGLAEALAQNIYNKFEVDEMYKEALKEHREEFREQLQQQEKEWREERHKLALEIERMTNRTITILGGLIVIVGLMATFSHAFFH